MYGGFDGMEGSGAGGAGCMVVLVAWRGLVLGCRVYGGFGRMEGSGV